MPNWEKFHVKMDSIHDEWNKSEEAIKAAEQVNGRVILPAVKELRYAGRRIVEAIHLIGAGDDDEAAKRLQDAEFNCYRARHDAIDAATAKIAIDLEAAASRLGHGAILAGYSKFPDMWQMLESIRRRITQSRRYREKRDEIYTEINDEFISLIEMYRSYKGSENIIITFARRERRKQFISYTVGGLSILIAIATAIARWVF